jgi:hypothetical protein
LALAGNELLTYVHDNTDFAHLPATLEIFGFHLNCREITHI